MILEESGFWIGLEWKFKPDRTWIRLVLTWMTSSSWLWLWFIWDQWLELDFNLTRIGLGIKLDLNLTGARLELDWIWSELDLNLIGARLNWFESDLKDKLGIFLQPTLALIEGELSSAFHFLHLFIYFSFYFAFNFSFYLSPFHFLFDCSFI